MTANRSSSQTKPTVTQPIRGLSLDSGKILELDYKQHFADLSFPHEEIRDVCTQANTLDYTCQLFPTQRREIFIRILWNHENARKPSENLRRQSERFRRCSDHLRNPVPGYPLPSITSSLSKIGESSPEGLSFMRTIQSIIALSTNYTLSTYYVECIFEYILHIFKTLVRYGGNNSFFPVRREKLVRRRG